MSSSSYVPKQGDRVRVSQVFEGRVVTHEGYFDVVTDEGPRHSFEYEEVAEGDVLAHHFEKVATPLPTTPGSVVRDRNGQIWMRQDKDDARNGYSWISPDSNKCGDGYLGFSTFEVVFDAGQDS